MHLDAGGGGGANKKTATNKRKRTATSRKNLKSDDGEEQAAKQKKKKTIEKEGVGGRGRIIKLPAKRSQDCVIREKGREGKEREKGRRASKSRVSSCIAFLRGENCRLNS